MSSKPLSKLLLIEDNPGDARLIVEMFNDQALNIASLTHVTCMSDAEKKLIEYDYDLILLDVGLPDVDGLEAVRRAHAAAPQIPLVVLTGLDDEDLARHALQEGAQDYLIKGEIEARGLLRSLRYAVERKLTEETARVLAEAEGDFLASMSHELRTPLNAIIGFSGLMMDSGELQPRDARYAQLIQHASNTLLAIINDVLDVSKLEAGNFDLDPRPFSPAHLVRNTVEFLRAQAEAKGLELEAVIDPALPALMIGDDTRVRQILLNLLSNAVKFTSKGFVRVSANVQATESGDRTTVRFSVIDSGIGIPKSKRHRLFKRFSQVDSSTSRQFGGSGLGLSICKSLIEIMGGTMELDSEEGWGSEFAFVVTLPVSEAVAAVEDVERQPLPATKGLRILLAEDVPMNQELAVALLTRWGYDVDVAGDGAAALDAVRRKTYDAILMDIQMPVMDGVEATRRIRGLGGAYATIPIIAVTACVFKRDIEKFLEAGMTCHVCKPFVPSELLAAIEICAGGNAVAITDTPVDGAAPEGLALLDHAIFDPLWETFGFDQMRSLLGKFQVQLNASFASVDGSVRDLPPLRLEAHSLVSTAGALGFQDLAGACQDLERACHDEKVPDAELNAMVARVQRVKKHTQRELRKELVARDAVPFDAAVASNPVQTLARI